MKFNPFEEKPKKIESVIMSWKDIFVKPYNKNEVSPYTKTRIILMNGTEFEATWCKHHFNRHYPDNDARRAVAFLRRIADLIMTIIIYGAIDGTDILSILFSVAMETVQVLAVYLISSCVLKNHEVPTAEYLPLKKIYSKGNPLQISAIFAGLVLSAVKVLSRIIYDVFYGLPESLIEVLSMILFYASDMLVSVIAYGAILIIVAGIHRSALVKKQD